MKRARKWGESYKSIKMVNFCNALTKRLFHQNGTFNGVPAKIILAGVLAGWPGRPSWLGFLPGFPGRVYWRGVLPDRLGVLAGCGRAFFVKGARSTPGRGPFPEPFQATGPLSKQAW